MKRLILFLSLIGAALGQTIPPGSGVYSLNAGSGGGGGSGTVSPGTLNQIPKYTGATTVGDSLASDDGTTFSYTGTGGGRFTGPISTGIGGSAAGTLELSQGTAPTAGTTSIKFYAPAAVASYIRTFPGAAGTGFYLGTNSAGVVTDTQVTPGTGVATAMTVAANATGGFVTAGGAPRILTITSSATPAIDTDSYDCVTITALATDITSMTSSRTGTINNFQQLEIRIKDDGTARAITWGADFASGMATLPTTTILGKTLTVYLEGDTVTGDFMCQATGSYP